MKTWGDIPGVSKIYGKNKNVSKISDTNKIRFKKDELSISDTAKDYQVAIKYLKDIPDIRREKVEEIAKSIKSGKYDVNGHDIADKILKSVFFDKKV